jgi:hypothetical protein
VVPHAADALAALEHGHVVVRGALEHHDRADATESPADHSDLPHRVKSIHAE